MQNDRNSFDNMFNHNIQYFVDMRNMGKGRADQKTEIRGVRANEKVNIMRFNNLLTLLFWMP